MTSGSVAQPSVAPSTGGRVLGAAASSLEVRWRRVGACGEPGPRPGNPRLDGDPPEREPALELGLHREALADLRLDLQLALGVALLTAPRGDERVPVAALVVVDEVDRLLRRVLEGKDGGQDAIAVAADRQRVAHRVDADREILEVRFLHDHPAVAELVVGRLNARADLVAGALEPLLHLGDNRLEVARPERLEDDRRLAARPDPLLVLEVDVGGGDREQAVRRGAPDLWLAQQRVEEAH